MSQDAALPGWRLRAPVRRIVVRFAEVACPPEVRAGDVMGGLLAEFEALLGALPTGARWLVQGGLVAFDQGARLYPRAHGRRFARLGDDDADAYFRAIVARPRGGLAVSVQRIKGLVVFCYYEQPEVQDMRLLKAGADAKGWKIIPNLRNQLHCAGSNNCTNGCPTGAKRSMLVTSIPRALRRGARLFADCRVERITSSAGAVTGIKGRFARPGGRRGPRLTVRAAVVVVAGGAVQTPALLARSGLRSASGQLGRNLTVHPNAKVIAVFDEEVTGWKGVHQAYQVREFADDGILLTAVNLPPSLVAMTLPTHGRELGELMARYNHMITAGCLIEDTGSGRVRNIPGLGPQVFYQLTDRDADRVIRGVAHSAELMFAAGARRVLLPFAGAPEVHDPDALRDAIARPAARKSLELFTVHLMGTARMSQDPRRGVTDSFGAFHGVPGLYVADASLFPSPIGVNPMETILALATRNAHRLIEQRARHGI